MGALLGISPALPLHEAGKYVAGAYIVLFALVLIYVAIMSIRLGRIERDLGELLELSEPKPEDEITERTERGRETNPAYPMEGHPQGAGK